MKLPVALGLALAALTVAGASAQSSSRHVIVHGGSGAAANIDANEDGWITRAEASAAFERIFADLDGNNDGRLDSADRRDIRLHVGGSDVRVLEGGDGRHVRVIRNGEDIEIDEEAIEREIERAMERAERHTERAEQLAERAERHARDVERRVEVIEDGERREVVIIRSNGGTWTSEDGDVHAIAPVAPVPPVPPVPPAPHFMMLVANSEEADLNGDGALSLEEFRNQHLRFFDASDANGDGRIRFERPAPPPPAPAPPAPPEPPRRR